ncbi:hypothetical protein Tsubulata_040029 [Turnera subulata]|uniref:HMA domain-containing protein n=1 Tax=Turnera subulata TaxID=218843 RepID=A0A9Q0FBH0_9ROSI|nr:hypothetical protein Tsubulata_040029 [Turnera subulata]
MSSEAIQNFTLKVYISCCTICPEKVKEKLQKIKGVDSVSINVSKDLVTITGSVEPGVIIHKFEKWGKKAKFWSPTDTPPLQEDDDHLEENENSHDETKDAFNHGKVNGEKHYRGIDFSEFDAIRGEDVMRSNKKGGLFGLAKQLVGIKSSKKPKPNIVKRVNPNKWQFPNAHLRELAPRLAQGSAYHGRPPFNVQPAPPHMYGPRPPLPAYGVMPPIPPAFGYMPPPRPPRANPITHFTSYEDNYRYW